MSAREQALEAALRDATAHLAGLMYALEPAGPKRTLAEMLAHARQYAESERVRNPLSTALDAARAALALPPDPAQPVQTERYDGGAEVARLRQETAFQRERIDQLYAALEGLLEQADLGAVDEETQPFVEAAREALK